MYRGFQHAAYEQVHLIEVTVDPSQVVPRVLVPERGFYLKRL